MTIRVGTLETHYAIAAHRLTHLPVRAIVGQWVRELGARNGVAVFPGPRRSPGNVTSAHVGRVCGHLEGGSRTERHNFPVFCTTTDGVREYAWYFNNLSYYRQIASRAAGDWKRACDLIEASPWSSDHYGRTLDATARACAIAAVRANATTTNLRSGPGRRFPVVARVPVGYLLAGGELVTGENTHGSAGWHRVRYGRGDGRIVYVHSSVADRATL